MSEWVSEGIVEHSGWGWWGWRIRVQAQGQETGTSLWHWVSCISRKYFTLFYNLLSGKSGEITCLFIQKINNNNNHSNDNNSLFIVCLQKVFGGIYNSPLHTQKEFIVFLYSKLNSRERFRTWEEFTLYYFLFTCIHEAKMRAGNILSWREENSNIQLFTFFSPKWLS